MSETRQQRPSQQLLQAVMAWVDNTVEDRTQKEDALLACYAEAKRFRRASYPRLYRGLSLTTEELATLRSGSNIVFDLPRLSAWTLRRRVAETYAEFGDADYGAVLAIPGTLVTPIIDCSIIIRFFSQAEIDAATDRDDYSLSDMAWEHEVIVSHRGGFTIQPELVAMIFEPDETGRIVRRPLRAGRRR